MRMLTDLLYDDFGSPKKGTYPLPCQVIENLTYDYSEQSGIDPRTESTFMVRVHFPNLKYREITHVQEYDLESLVGDIGGYIGLFLGYTLLHFPRFVISMYHIIKKKIVPGVQHVRQNTLCSKSVTTTEIKELQARQCASSTASSKGYGNTGLVDVNKQLNEITRRMDEIETQISIIQETSRYGNPKSSNCVNVYPVSSNSPLQKVRVKEWNNSANTPDFI